LGGRAACGVEVPAGAVAGLLKQLLSAKSNVCIEILLSLLHHSVRPRVGDVIEEIAAPPLDVHKLCL
jgi:hypothetical protein